MALFALDFFLLAMWSRSSWSPILGADLSASKYWFELGLSLWIFDCKWWWSWKTPFFECLHGDNGQNFIFLLGAFLFPFIYTSTWRKILFTLCTSFWWRDKFITDFPHLEHTLDSRDFFLISELPSMVTIIQTNRKLISMIELTMVSTA